MKRVLLGMSGGVDSSVSAILLKNMGYEVVGVTMQLLGETENLDAVEDAKKVCELLEISHYVINLKEEFKNSVIDDFICCYNQAKTPNPCVECNKYIKFGAMYKKALELNCDYLATGHYADIEYSDEYNQYILKKSKAEGKDQTYFLYGIAKEILPKILFPLAKFLDKNEIRKLAEENNLNVAQKSDSQEICFIKENDYVKFLEENNSCLNQKSGNIVFKDGTVLGKHNGLINYTIGQRKGLGIAYSEPLYVIKLDKEKNDVIVGVEKDLYSTELEAKELNFLIDIDKTQEIEVMTKIRYRAKEAKAKINFISDDKVKVIFEEPQRAVTPGQAVVFYKNDIVMGGGKII